MTPFFSINIPTKDRAHVIQDALASIVRQTFTDYEIIVVNDGSSDNTREVLIQFQAQYPDIFITVIDHETSRGVAVSRQEALEASSGTYIAILDDDDEWIHSDKLKLQAEFLQNHPEVGLLGTWARMIDAQTKQEWLWQPPTEDQQIRRQILSRNPFVNPTIVFDRLLALKQGGFNKKYEYADDYAFCILMGTKTKMHILSEYTVRFQINAGGMTERHRLAFIKAGLHYCHQYRKNYPGYFKALLKWYVQIAVISIFGPTAWSRLKHGVLRPFSKMYERTR